MENNPTAPAPAPTGESDWAKIPLTDGKYMISNNGEVAKLLKNGKKRILKPYKNNTPYLSVKIYDKKGKCYNKYVHRLVAENFLKKRDGCEVNHKNGEKTDNRAINLEWVSHSENNIHKFNKLSPNIKSYPVEVFSPTLNMSFSTIKDAADFFQVSTTTIRRNLEGFTKTVKGVNLIRKETI